jgi:hypothetical protein
MVITPFADRPGAGQSAWYSNLKKIALTTPIQTPWPGVLFIRLAVRDQYEAAVQDIPLDDTAADKLFADKALWLATSRADSIVVMIPPSKPRK